MAKGMSMYGIFFGGRWALSRSKKRALALAKREGGYVMVLRSAFGAGTPRRWDAPTFRTTAELLADFRQAKD